MISDDQCIISWTLWLPHQNHLNIPYDDDDDDDDDDDADDADDVDDNGGDVDDA